MSMASVSASSSSAMAAAMGGGLGAAEIKLSSIDAKDLGRAVKKYQEIHSKFLNAGLYLPIFQVSSDSLRIHAWLHGRKTGFFEDQLTDNWYGGGIDSKPMFKLNSPALALTGSIWTFYEKVENKMTPDEKQAWMMMHEKSLDATILLDLAQEALNDTVIRDYILCNIQDPQPLFRRAWGEAVWRNQPSYTMNAERYQDGSGLEWSDYRTILLQQNKNMADYMVQFYDAKITEEKEAKGIPTLVNEGKWQLTDEQQALLSRQANMPTHSKWEQEKKEWDAVKTILENANASFCVGDLECFWLSFIHQMKMDTNLGNEVAHEWAYRFYNVLTTTPAVQPHLNTLLCSTMKRLMNQIFMA